MRQGSVEGEADYEHIDHPYSLIADLDDRLRPMTLSDADRAAIEERDRLAQEPGWLPDTLPLYAKTAYADRHTLLAALSDAEAELRIASGLLYATEAERDAARADAKTLAANGHHHPACPAVASLAAIQRHVPCECGWDDALALHRERRP